MDSLQDPLPINILIHIASIDVPTYRAMLSIPTFARALLKDKASGDQLGILIRRKLSIIMIKDGYPLWTLNGKQHYEGGPSYCNDKLKSWAQYGWVHRVDGPAIEYANGDQEWYLHGRYHREDGPAKEINGDKYWYLYGNLHREDGPAKEWSTGERFWYLYGNLHRNEVDGPAEEYGNGIECWWNHGHRYRSIHPKIDESNITTIWAINIRMWQDDGHHIYYVSDSNHRIYK